MRHYNIVLVRMAQQYHSFTLSIYKSTFTPHTASHRGLTTDTRYKTVGTQAFGSSYMAERFIDLDTVLHIYRVVFISIESKACGWNVVCYKLSNSVN